MRVALVYPACHRRGGVERVVFEVARHLAGRHEVVVVASEGDVPPGAQVAEVAVGRVRGPAAMVRFCSRAAAVVAGVTADVVVTFGSECPPGDVFVMGSVHRAWVEVGGPGRLGPLRLPAWARHLSPRHAVTLALERRAVARTRWGYVAVSERVAADLCRLYGVPAHAVAVVGNGYDPEQFSPLRAAMVSADLRDEVGFGQEDRVLLMVANEYARKGLDVVLEAMADPRLARGPSRTRLLLAGRSDPRAYRPMIERLGLARDVVWLGAVDDVARCYGAADLLVLPTRYEPFGSVIVEALACGLPVVTSALAGASPLVDPGRNGFVLERPEDPGELATVLVQALDPATLGQLAQAAPSSVAGCRWTDAVARLEEVLLAAGGRQAGETAR